MTPERWQQIETLYQAVMDLPPEERARRLSAADDEVRSEVESLLRNGHSKGMLEGKAIQVAAQQYVSVETSDLRGRKLGRYAVISRLGAGGMGVVYRARDTRLNRDVALKVLPAASIADAARKRQFVQEARAASALNHPNIISVHDIDQIDGIDFITMECVSGKTLAEVIGRKAPPVREALAYGIQIAGALAAAHAAGIVHRDLKPGNVMVTAEGQVKVLDFGLAKLTERREDGDSTASGAAIAGTPAYMSPEQAEGKKVDARSDIFSFGAVIYEMLTGRSAFGRDSLNATVAAVLRDDPAPLLESVPGL
jgi:serine/threonine protein kinase